MDTDSEIKPLKIGVRSHPPAITLIYIKNGKQRYRLMPARFLNKFGSVENVLNDLKSRHKMFLEKVL